MNAVRGLWDEFKAFALGGNMLDLALGFIIGTAFAGLVNSLAADVIMQFVAAIVGKPDFSDLVFTINSSEIRYGSFLTVMINFLLLAAVLFGLVKLLKRAGLGDFKIQGSRPCPYCKESIPLDVTRCKACTSEVEPMAPGAVGTDEPVPVIAEKMTKNP